VERVGEIDNSSEYTSRVQQTMESTTDLVMRPKHITTTTAIITRGCHRPTSADWNRWLPRVMARYKSVPARVIIAEMKVDGLLVTYVFSKVLNT